MNRLSNGIAALAACAVLLAACQREAPQPVAAPVDPPPASGAEADDAVLKDIIETDPRYVIGISYPPEASRYPGLASALRRYSDAARGELMQAVEETGDSAPSAPYDLSLSYTMLNETPSIVAVAADGSSYTGGAHGNPLVARFVWLPARGEILRSEALFTDPAGWNTISAYIREQLHAALSSRVEADDLAPAERSQVVRSAGRMIDEGSGADAANFDQFEPVLDESGRLRGLRFVFPPYQVGPYADGVQTVEVPAAVLLPHVAAPYRGLFVTR